MSAKNGKKEENKEGRFDYLKETPYTPEEFRELYEELTIYEYLDKLYKDARPSRTAYQRLYDTIMEKGSDVEKTLTGEQEIRYKFFDDLRADGKPGPNAIYGIDPYLMILVRDIGSAATKSPIERKLQLLVGPVSSAKSSIASLFKRALEVDSRINAVYTFEWAGLGNVYKDEGFRVKDTNVYLFDHVCQMHEDPLKLLDKKSREKVLNEINEANKDNELMKYKIWMSDQEWDMCIHCRFNYEQLMQHYDGNWDKVMEHVKVKRFTLSEIDRMGIGTFKPADEKNQDSTELTGDLDYRLIARFGSRADPRAFNLSGELCIANRGLVEFIEMLKLEREFLYELLTASQEKVIKPKNFALTPIDAIILGHTNEEELERLKDDELNKAIQSRTNMVVIPYNLKLKHEPKIYEKMIANREKIVKPENLKHLCPHTLDVASMYVILTRLEEPKETVSKSLTLIQKMKLYNDEDIAGFTASMAQKLRKDALKEGRFGLSPRYVQEALSDTFSEYKDTDCINPLMVLKMLGDLLDTNLEVETDEDKLNFGRFIEDVEKEWRDMVLEEVQIAISCDESALTELCSKYLTNLRAYKDKATIFDPVIGRHIKHDESFMRSIETKIGVMDTEKDSFRNSLLSYIGKLTVEKKQFDYTKDERLHKALLKYLYDIERNKINLEGQLTGLMTKEDQDKIDIVKGRLKSNFGYCDTCASVVLAYLARPDNRGDAEVQKQY